MTAIFKYINLANLFRTFTELITLYQNVEPISLQAIDPGLRAGVTRNRMTFHGNQS